MTDQSKIAFLAAGMAQANPDAAEELGGLLSRAARSVKVGGMAHGIAIWVNRETRQIEIRGGLLADYVDGKAPGRYVEVKGDLDLGEEQ